MGNVIGIDGGGTKTIAVLARTDGTIIASCKVGPTNANVLTNEKLQVTLEQLMHNLQREAPHDFGKVTSLFAGMSGAGLKQTRLWIAQKMQQILPSHVNIQIGPDTLNALYAGTYGSEGIVQIAGTGSITYGINKAGKEHRSGGWGYLLGDEGSGYDIGRRGIVTVLKNEDGRGGHTKLTKKIYDYFQVKNGRELVSIIYANEQPKDLIAPLNKIVFEAYKQQDCLAQEIIYHVMKELCFSIMTVYHTIFKQQEPVQVILSGGVFHDRDVLVPLIQTELEKSDHISVKVPKIPPVGGSVIKAIMQQNIVVNKNIINQLSKSLQL